VDRVSASEAEGRWFDSSQTRHSSSSRLLAVASHATAPPRFHLERPAGRTTTARSFVGEYRLFVAPRPRQKANAQRLLQVGRPTVDTLREPSGCPRVNAALTLFPKRSALYTFGRTVKRERPTLHALPAPKEIEGGATRTQTMQTLLRLRDLVLRGQLAPGERIAELVLVEWLGVSRTPIRAALLRLEQEGLLESVNARGYRVRRFSERDIEDAIELRGTGEGLAARLAAERGVSRTLLDRARECLQAIDAAFASPGFGAAQFECYVEGNERFHSLLAQMSGSDVVQRQLERVHGMPFASPNAFMQVQAATPGARDTLWVAQDQHAQVLDAIERREGARAEALMREHARLARRNLERALTHGPSLALVPGAALIRRAA
jgi:GntR family transcriptional regulator of vanillate catabolism